MRISTFVDKSLEVIKWIFRIFFLLIFAYAACRLIAWRVCHAKDPFPGADLIQYQPHSNHLPDPYDKSAVDIGIDSLKNEQPVPRFVNLMLHQSLLDGAERIEFSLEELSSGDGFRISYTSTGQTHEFPRAPSSLFNPAVAVLCKQASVAYYAGGRIKGRIKTKHPNSSWLLESDDPKKRVLLLKE